MMKPLLPLFTVLFIFTAASWSDETADITELTQKARSGDTAAQFDLALHYLFAKRLSKTDTELPPDYPKAAAWTEKAAEAGHPKAQYLMGVLCERGRGVKKNANDAIHWYKEALRNGVEDAACPLAHLYEKSDIFPQDPEVSRRCYMK